MGLFDIFKFKGKSQKDAKVSISVEFTDEEIEAINKNLDTYQSFAAKDGKQLVLAPKALEALKAQGIFEYAMQLIVATNDSNLSSNETVIILDKAVKAQLKACGLHDLPLYLFHVACTYELIGNIEKAEIWFKNFLRLQGEFKPDKVDEINLNFLINMQGFDAAEAVGIARQKLEK
jgi:tetratricopeptide (TPR) repeat protein